MSQAQREKSWLSAEKEARLVEKARGRNRKAFEQLVNAFQKPLVGFILTRSTASQSDAEDIAQDVWCEVWEQIHRPAEENGYDPTKGRFYTFLINYFAMPKIKDWQRDKIRSHERTGMLETDDRRGVREPAAPTQSSQPDVGLQVEEHFRLANAAFLELLRLTFLCGGYPHQQLAFAYSKLIYGQPSPRGIEGAAEKVHHEHGAVPLDTLTSTFWEAYASASRLTAELLQRINHYLDPVRFRLPLKVAELVQLDSASRTQFKRLLRKKVGQTRLRDYYAHHKGSFTAAIPDWSYKVEKRTREILGLKKGASQNKVVEEVIQRRSHGPIQPRGCNRCKLRHVPPCNRGYKKKDMAVS